MFNSSEHVITANGLQPDAAKIRAIVDMTAPYNMDVVRRLD